MPGILSRLLSPSVADLLFLLVIAWSFLGGEKGWNRLFMDGDTGLHIRIGDLILQNGKVPYTDPFSFALVGREWFAFEWGTEVIQAALHEAWGLKGVAIMTAIVLSASFVLVYLFSLWRGANGGISLLLTLAAVNAATIHFHARPHIFTLLLLVTSAWILERDRRQNGAILWSLVPITVLWANLHGGFLILFVLTGLMTVGSLCEGWLLPGKRAARWTSARRFSLAGAACLAASLVNPYGYHLHQHILETMQAKWLVILVDEFKSPSFRGEQMAVFMALLFVGLALVGRLIAKRSICEALIILFFAWASLLSVRHVPLYMLMAAPIAASELTALWTGFAATLPRTSVFRILDDVFTKLGAGNAHPSLWAAAFAVFLAVSPSIQWPTDFAADLFPTELAFRRADQLASSRLFTSDQWAGYLVYKNFPRQKVFIDGRHNYYGEKVVKEALSIINARETAAELLDRYKIDSVMIPPNSALATLLHDSKGWKLADRDKLALLFVRERS